MVAQVLYVNGFIFDFATQYAFKHPTIAPAKSFALTDQEYDEFVNWMKGKEYLYQSPLEIELHTFEAEAKKEKYYDDLKPQLDQLHFRLKESRKNDLVIFKDQIKKLLEEEIASRYYLEKGATEAGFKFDREIKRAVEALHNQVEYRKILNLN